MYFYIRGDSWKDMGRWITVFSGPTRIRGMHMLIKEVL